MIENICPIHGENDILQIRISDTVNLTVRGGLRLQMLNLYDGTRTKDLDSLSNTEFFSILGHLESKEILSVTGLSQMLQRVYRFLKDKGEPFCGSNE